MDMNNMLMLDENTFLRLMEQSFDGVMFHNYSIDLFDLLHLEGFKKLHMQQYQDEGNNLAELKHYYIHQFNQLPSISSSKNNLWSNPIGAVSEESIPDIVKNALNTYYSWESDVLTNLLSWRKESKEKIIFQNKIKDVMLEIERLETLMSILEEHDYNYECICEVSNYLANN